MAGTAGAPGRGHRPICSIDKVATGCHDDAPGPRRMCWRQGESAQSPPAQPPGRQPASDAKEVPHTCSWAGTHKPAATRGTRQTPRGVCTRRRAPAKAETRGPHGEGRPDPRQTPREAPAPRAAHETHAHPEARRARQPASPGRPHPTSFTCGPRNPRCAGPSECVHGVCVCVCVCVKRDHLRGPSPAPHRAVTTPSPPPPSPGSQPRTQASNHSSPLLPGETWGRMQVPAGHPVAFSADSSWEGPPRSGHRPDHHLDTQAWGSPTAIAAG